MQSLGHLIMRGFTILITNSPDMSMIILLRSLLMQTQVQPKEPELSLSIGTVKLIHTLLLQNI